MEMIEATATSVEAAIKKGLAELNASPAEVVIEVLEEPNTGLFGFGARKARVRLVLIGPRKSETAKAPAPVPETPRIDPKYREEEYEPVAVSDAELGEDAVVGKQVVEELLDKMRIRATVTARQAEEEAEGEEPPWMININGDSVNRLIGRRGDTLSSLQYIVRLICSRRLQRRANIVVDADGYKAGRSNRLRGLANRMAKQAVRQGRTITLEPMNANERRVIHLTLRNSQEVFTRSVGEGRERKVTIVPK